jgi:carbon-monoxide dehydrogenase medium subunit
MHEAQDRSWVYDRYERPATMEEALDLIDRHGQSARVIAGGTDLLLEMQRKVRDVSHLIDLAAIPALGDITKANGNIHLGPLVTHKDVVASAMIRDMALPLAQASLEVGSAQLRNRATVAGNLITASPANDTISALLALDATVELRSVRSVRTVALRDFYLGVRRTVMQSNEIMTSIRFQSLTDSDSGVFAKIGLRSAQAISVVHGAVVLTHESGVISNARIALGSVAPIVVLVDAADGLVGNELTDRLIESTARNAASEVTPISDGRATAGYRTEIVAVAVRRMLHSLKDRTERDHWPGRVTTLSAAQRVHPPPPLSAGPGDPMTLSINGNEVHGPVGLGVTLLDWIRDNSPDSDGQHLTGTKAGCGEGECGACTVHMDGEAVLACLVPCTAAVGTTIVTIEGLESERDRAIQEAFVDTGAVQCGFCTPGFVMAASSLVAEHDNLTAHEIRDGLSGNICRCTGYESIVTALTKPTLGHGDTR